MSNNMEACKRTGVPKAYCTCIECKPIVPVSPTTEGSAYASAVFLLEQAERGVTDGIRLSTEQAKALLARLSAGARAKCAACKGTGDERGIPHEPGASWNVTDFGCKACGATGFVPEPSERQPDGYAYRYPDGCIRFSGGHKINGSDPVESIPYYFRRAPEPAAQPDLVGAIKRWQQRGDPCLCRGNLGDANPDCPIHGSPSTKEPKHG